MAQPTTGAPRPGTRDPHRSRMRALKVLFQADLRGDAADAVLDRVLADPQALALLDDQDEDEAGTTGQIDAYAQQLVRGVAANRPDLDALIDQFSRRWSVARMPAVDRNVLRLAAYEVQFEDTSPAVVIDEALELVKGMSTDNSARFVNGVLEAIRRHLTPANDSTG